MFMSATPCGGGWTSCSPQPLTNQCFDESVKLLSATDTETKILKMLSKILMAGRQLRETWPDIWQTTLHVPETSYKKDLLRNSIVH